MKKLALTIGLTLAPQLALANGSEMHTCKNGPMQRRVEIVDQSNGAPTGPCQVNYHKDTEAPGEVKVLWSAQNELAYCKRNADQFVTKLQGWGWSCAQDQAQATAQAQAPAKASAPAQQPAKVGTH